MVDKLTSLLNKFYGEYFDVCPEANDESVALAEYLINNGVIVLPCKPGTKIYHIDLDIPENEQPCSDCPKNYSGFGEFWCDDNYIGWPSMEEKLLEPEHVCPKYKPGISEEKFTLSFWASYEKWFNKTWFLTEEEANKALEEFKA